MANLFVRTYTFIDGTTAYGSQVETEVGNIVNVLNNLNAASTNWGRLSVLNAVSVPLIADCASGSQDIADFKNNSVIKASIGPDGTITTVKTSNQLVLGTTNTTTISSTAPAASRVYTIPDAGATAVFVLSTASNYLPTIQKFTSGSGTYTTPAGCTWIRVRMVGAGGGGTGSGTAAGSASGSGGTTTFGTTLLSASGGAGGSWASGPNAGGAASLGSGPIGIALQGGYGAALNDGTGTVQRPSGGHGGSTPFGGAGAGGQVNQAGSAGITNTGSGGGGGGGFSNVAEVATGQGGGAGGFVDAIITAPSATYAYAVGGAGTAGTAGTNGFAGGAGGSGLIIVEEHYH